MTTLAAIKEANTLLLNGQETLGQATNKFPDLPQNIEKYNRTALSVTKEPMIHDKMPSLSVAAAFKESISLPPSQASTRAGSCVEADTEVSTQQLRQECVGISERSKQQVISRVYWSVHNTEYIGLSEACREALYLKELQYEITNKMYTISIFNDNQGAQKLCANPVFHKRTKHRGKSRNAGRHLAPDTRTI
ncbi:unnamed protein product [Danaus chrysippus]|uniref:(African queen) hypothetical protein n=1 Tax=Danaus chrysippus TaxID=151541 RepID=A0A8J2QHG5_9NEOP|nr:unnamed protein product [Danaus chrysippus]